MINWDEIGTLGHWDTDSSTCVPMSNYVQLSNSAKPNGHKGLRCSWTLGQSWTWTRRTAPASLDLDKSNPLSFCRFVVFSYKPKLFSNIDLQSKTTKRQNDTLLYVPPARSQGTLGVLPDSLAGHAEGAH
jgi:hypothetical protein